LRAISHELNIRVKAFLKKSLSAQHGFEGSEYAADDIGNDKGLFKPSDESSRPLRIQPMGPSETS